MIELARCCLTCAHSDFIGKDNLGTCCVWKGPNRYREEDWNVEIAKVMVCEHWKNAQLGIDKWSKKQTKQRTAYWRRMIESLQKTSYLNESKKDGM